MNLLQINDDRHNSFVCRNCLSTHRTQGKLNEHGITYLDKDAKRPVKQHENYLKWSRFFEKMPIYLALYADFESLNIPIENVDQDDNTIK